MRRILLALVAFVVGVPLILGGVLGYAYVNTDQTSMPEVKLVVLEEEVHPNGWDWNQPVFFGMMFKELRRSASLEADYVGTLYEPVLDIEFPAGYTHIVRLEKSGETLWTGVSDEWANYNFTGNGNYVVEVESEKKSENKEGYGTLIFRFTFSVNLSAQPEAGED